MTWFSAVIMLGVVAVNIADTHAQTAWKPAKTVEIVVGAAPAGGADLTARLAQKILQELKLVEAAGVVNKPGGGQTIAWAYLNQHAGDANYLSVVNEPIVTNRVIGASALDHNDFTPLALLFDEYMILR